MSPNDQCLDFMAWRNREFLKEGIANCHLFVSIVDFSTQTTPNPYP